MKKRSIRISWKIKGKKGIVVIKLKKKLIVWVNKWDKPVVVTHSCPEIDPYRQQGKSNIYTSPQGMACL